ncbi:hypothetical protein EV426DRAFT_720757 [Tirmania nivea]|nr:hypothetical protein EV426DRAFT_720757 [Tirmania nivea]
MAGREPAPAASAASMYEQELRIPNSLYITGKGHEAQDLEVRYGELASIAGPSGSGKTLLGLHAVTTHLLTHPESHAAWVDTVGGFSARWLKEVVEGRVAEARAQAEDEGGEGVVLGESEEGKIVGGVLDRVWVMRVFNWWGLVEAVGEVRGHVEGEAAVVELPEAVLNEGGGQELKDHVVESSPLSSPPTSPPSSPPPSPQIVSPSPTKCIQPQLLLHPPSQVSFTRGVTEIPDSDAESDEDVLVSGSGQYSPLHDLPTRSQGSQLPHEIPGGPDGDGDDSLPGSPFRPTYAHARGNTEISLSGHTRDDVPITQVPSSPLTFPGSSPLILAAAAEPHCSPEPAIGILVIDTITHPVETLISKAASSSGNLGSSGGTVPAGVAGVYALLEKYFRELGGWAKEWGIGVLLLNNTFQSQSPHEPPAPVLGPMFQHVLDMSVILQNNTSRARRWRAGDSAGGIESIGFEVLHDRGGEWGGRMGVVGVKGKW